MIFFLVAGVVSGLISVWKSSDYAIGFVLRLARHYKVSTFFVGFVFLALVANIPEFSVAAVAGLQGAGQLAAGDIIGACFSDVALVSGFMLLCLGSASMQRHEARGLLRLIGASTAVLLVVFMLGALTRWHGVVLITIYLFFLIWSWRCRHEHTFLEVTTDDLLPHRLSRQGLYALWGKILLALLGVLGGSWLVIECSVALAKIGGMSLESIGATIIGVGTSLPEIAMGFHAYRRGQYSLALGPTIGTVFSQSTFILGTLALLSTQPIVFAPLLGAAVFMFIAFALLSLSVFFGKMGRVTGIALLGLFVMYLLYHIAPF